MNAATDAERSGEIAIAFMLGGGLFVFAMVAGVGRFVSKGIVNATNQLTEGAEQFAHGNLDHRIEVQTGDELGFLLLCSQSLFRFANLGDDGLCRGGPDKGCGVIVSAIDVVVDRLD